MSHASKWLKFDFHTHTPSSDDYGRGDQTLKNISPEQWLQKAMESGLDCVVVSDHNSAGWIDGLKQENLRLQAQEQRPQWFRPLTIFPGLEITVADSNSRIHLLAIFDPNYDTDKITLTLGACGYQRNLGDTSSSTSHGFLDCLKAIKDAGGIPLPAHIDGPKGLLERRQLTLEVQKSLENVFAAEFCDIHSFDDATPELKRLIDRVAKVMGSDAHKPEDIGKKFSWIKLNPQPTIDDLRLALMEPEFSVKNQEDNPNIDPPIFLSRLSISAMKHCGRIEGRPFVMNLDPHFNAIIGGRGAGKSTVLESIRIAMRQDQRLDAEAPIVKANLEKFMRRPEENGVLLENTKILVELYRHNKKFQLEWCANGTGSILKSFDGGEWKEGEVGKVQERFPISIFSQKQISELAENPRALLEIIDRAASVNGSEWKVRWERCERRFLQLKAQKREIERQLLEATNVRTKLSDIENDLKEYEVKGHGKILKQFQKFSQQKNGLVKDAFFDAANKQLIELGDSMELSDFPSHLFEETDGTTEEIRTIHEELASELKQLSKAIEAIALRVNELKQQYTDRINASHWHCTLEANALAYADLVAQYTAKGNRLDLSLYGDLVQQRNSLQHQLKNMETLILEGKQLDSEIAQRENEFLSLRKELFDARQQFIQGVVGENQFVSMNLIPFGDCSDAEKKYREILNIEKDTFSGGIYDEESQKGILYPLKNCEKTSRFEEIPQLVADLKAHTYEIACGKSSNESWFCKKLKTLYAQKPVNFDQLDTWWPEDKLRVKFLRDNGNGSYEDIENGSVGQKSSAILAFLLSYGDIPLIIDQPEDDLDNSLVYDLIVRQIQQSKGRRQLVIVTHNANIVVNGDAECVHVLQFKSGQITNVCAGSLGNKEIRDKVCTIMEGGKQAFANRYHKILMRGQACLPQVMN